MILCLILIFRLLRWHLFLSSVGRVTFLRVLSAGSIGFMAIFIVPWRIGEFVRPVLISKGTDISVSTALGTVVSERIVDFVAVLIMFSTVVVLIGGYELPAVVVSAAYTSMAIFTPVVALIMLAAWKKTHSDRLIRSIAMKLPRFVSTKLTELYSSFIDGIRSINSMRVAIQIFLLTVIYWVLNGYGMYLMCRASNIKVPICAGFLVLSVMALFIMIPTAPGFIGNFEYGVVLGLSIFKIDPSISLAYAVAVHAFQALFICAAGMIFILKGDLPVGEIMDRVRSLQMRRTFQSHRDQPENEDRRNNKFC
jgi:hypothetical protein